ncbi:MAG: flavodoxin [Treponema sp.]
MAKVAIVYWSGTGNTQAMAEAILEGLKAGGADASLFTVGEFDKGSLSSYDKIAFGCPAMGSEELEPDEFEPFYSSIEGELKGKNIALFGSYEWADGEWMKTWEERAKGVGANVFEGEGLIIYDKPDDEGIAKCKAFGERFAK